MRGLKGLVAVGALALLVGCAGAGYRDQSVPMTSIAVFDPAKYAGTWYEVAHFPTPFQQGCAATTATYGAPVGGALSVLNECKKGGEIATIRGEARLVGPGRLKVRLDGVPFAADYWILWVDEGYRTAVVGVPSGRAGWILNREPTIPEDRLRAARAVLQFNGYDLSRLVPTATEEGE